MKSDIERIINVTLEWCTENKMILNLRKSAVLFFSAKPGSKKKIYNHNLPDMIKGIKI